MRRYLDQQIWLPILINGLPVDQFPSDDEAGTKPGELLIPFAGLKISGEKAIVQTSLAERQGSVKELYSIDDFQIQIRGFAIDKQRRIWPEEQLQALASLYKFNAAVTLDNAITNVFLETQRVVIRKVDLPEVLGGVKHVRPFTIDLSSDSVFNLLVE